MRAGPDVELHHIAVRAAFAFLTLLALLRVSGKRTIGKGTAFDFVLALVIGDLFDDLLWADVPASQFAVGSYRWPWRTPLCRG